MGNTTMDYNEESTITTQEKTSKYDVALECPVCGALSKSLKYRNRPRGVFLIVAASWSGTMFIACPSCVRKDILKNLLFLVLGFHIASPFLFLLIELPQLINSFFKGHCLKVRNIIDESELSPEELQKRQKAKKKRDTIITVVIIAIVVALFLTGFLLSQ
jgi:hypothetical protein